MKKLLALLMSLMMVASLVPSMVLADDTVTLKVTCWDVATTPYYEAIKTGYEAANPNVKIEWIDLASQDYNTKVSTMLSGGDDSDIMIV